MALSAAFHERLELMDRARTERLSLLQAEKELQASKSQVLASKYSNIGYSEQRCLMLKQKIASQNLKISILKSEIGSLDAKYSSHLQRLRGLKDDVEELEELERERDRFYEEKSREMEEFKDRISKFVVQSRLSSEELRRDLSKLLSDSAKLQGQSGEYDGAEVAAAETLRHELLTKKGNLDSQLAANRETRAKLQKLTPGS